MMMENGPQMSVCMSSRNWLVGGVEDVGKGQYGCLAIMHDLQWETMSHQGQLL